MKNFRSFVALILIILCSLSLFAQDKVDYHYFKSALQYKSKEDYKNAALDFSIFLRDNPEHKMATYFRAYCYLYLRHYDKSIEDFKRLMVIDPLDVDGPYGAGRASYEKGEFENAVQYYTKALQLNRAHLPSFNDRGMAYCRMHLFDQGLADFYKAMEVDSNFAMVYVNTGAARYFNQDLENPSKRDLRIAKGWFDKAIERDKELHLAYYNRAAVNFFLEDYEASLKDMNRTLLIDPEFPMNYFYTGVIYKKMGNYKRAVAEFNKTLKLNPDIPFALEEIAQVHKEKGEYDKAIEFYNKAANVRHTLGDIYRGLMCYRVASIEALQGNREAMYTKLKEAQKLDLFSDRKVYKEFLILEDFDKFRKETAFIKFVKAVTKGKKENKFLDPSLRWFRMQGVGQKG